MLDDIQKKNLTRPGTLAVQSSHQGGLTESFEIDTNFDSIRAGHQLFSASDPSSVPTASGGGAACLRRGARRPGVSPAS